jgi:predicted MFS family arabinose efflux permease
MAAVPARVWAFVLAALPAAIALAQGWDSQVVVVGGLILFGFVFAVKSAVHSYLILAYSDFDKVSMNVGFYDMANTGGRLAGTVLSGWAYQTHGLAGCLWWSAAFVLATALLSFRLPEVSARSGA